VAFVRYGSGSGRFVRVRPWGAGGEAAGASMKRAGSRRRRVRATESSAHASARYAARVRTRRKELHVWGRRTVTTAKPGMLRAACCNAQCSGRWCG